MNRARGSVTLKGIAEQIKEFTTLPPIAEAFREWMYTLDEEHYWMVARDVQTVYSAITYNMGMGVASALELCAIYTAYKQGWLKDRMTKK